MIAHVVAARRALVLVATCAALAVPACNCASPLSGVDAGPDAGNGVVDAGNVVDAGVLPHDAGSVVDSGVVAHDAGEVVDAGDAHDAGPFDAGNGFDLGQFLDGGAGACLPDSLPQLSITGALDALGFSPLYFGGPEHGVRCGLAPQQVTCGTDTPCCVLCGLAGCGVDITDAGAPPTCPFFATAYNCDGDEDCSGNDVCCFTLGGTECRAQSDCDFNVAATLGQFLQDGGISLSLPDAGVVDGGFFDGGFVDTFVDGGAGPDGGALDGGSFETPVEGPAGPVPDAGSFLDDLQSTLDQGVPVCHTFFDCNFGDACCSSDRLPALDIGFCLPALLCAGSLIP